MAIESRPLLGRKRSSRCVEIRFTFLLDRSSHFSFHWSHRVYKTLTDIAADDHKLVFLYSPNPTELMILLLVGEYWICAHTDYFLLKTVGEITSINTIGSQIDSLCNTWLLYYPNYIFWVTVDRAVSQTFNGFSRFCSLSIYWIAHLLFRNIWHSKKAQAIVRLTINRTTTHLKNLTRSRTF